MDSKNDNNELFKSFIQPKLVKAARLICAIVRDKALINNIYFQSLDINIDSSEQYVEIEALINEEESIFYQIKEDDPYEYSVWISMVAGIICKSLSEENEGVYELEDYDRLYQVTPDYEHTLLKDKHNEYSRSDHFIVSVYNPETLTEMESIIPYASLKQEYRGSYLPRDWDCEKHSILWMLGYQVGKNSPFLSNRERHEFLQCFINCNLPNIFPESYLALWGEASSVDRIRKLRKHISGLIYNKSWDKETYQCAISDWQNDIDFLDKNY